MLPIRMAKLLGLSFVHLSFHFIITHEPLKNVFSKLLSPPKLMEKVAKIIFIFFLIILSKTKKLQRFISFYGNLLRKNHKRSYQKGKEVQPNVDQKKERKTFKCKSIPKEQKEKAAKFSRESYGQ